MAIPDALVEVAARWPEIRATLDSLGGSAYQSGISAGVCIDGDGPAP